MFYLVEAILSTFHWREKEGRREEKEEREKENKRTGEEENIRKEGGGGETRQREAQASGSFNTHTHTHIATRLLSDADWFRLWWQARFLLTCQLSHPIQCLWQWIKFPISFSLYRDTNWGFFRENQTSPQNYPAETMFFPRNPFGWMGCCRMMKVVAS